MVRQEERTAAVYGETFGLYDRQAFDEFLAPLFTRLRANGIDRTVFQGKRCLDAGCGGGRGAVLMAESGASEVVGIDLSAANVETSRRHSADRGLTNVRFEQHSLLDLPFADDSFDVIWCNGVLHHTNDPDRGLREITRVLRTDGHHWLYVYGSGGIYWLMVDWARSILRDVDFNHCLLFLRLLNDPVRRIAEWLDDWFVPHLRRYSRDDVVARLIELGYDETHVRPYGLTYDTSSRLLNASSIELALMGEGDVRLFCRKARPPAGDRFTLPDPSDGKGSSYVDGPGVTQFEQPLSKIADALDRLEARSTRETATLYRIVACRSVHSHVPALLETERAFQTDALHRHLDGMFSLLEHVIADDNGHSQAASQFRMPESES